MYGIIYKIVNSINDKVYIGQTVNLYNRICQYKNSYNKREKSNRAICRAILKYGWNAFKFIEICQCDSRYELNQKEIFYIELFKSRNRKHGYNIASGGFGGNNIKWTKEKRLKRSLAYSKEKHPQWMMRGENSPHFIKIKLSDKLKICKLYNENKSIVKISTIFNVNPNKIRSILVECNIPIRSRKEVMSLLPQNNKREVKCGRIYIQSSK